MAYERVKGRPKLAANKAKVRVAMYLEQATWEAIMLQAHLMELPVGYVVDQWHRDRSGTPAAVGTAKSARVPQAVVADLGTRPQKAPMETVVTPEGDQTDQAELLDKLLNL